MTRPILNPEHRRVSDRANELVMRLIAAPILRKLEREDTALADALNSPEYERLPITNVEAPVATEAELEL